MLELPVSFIGPWVSGFVAVVSWRWCFWIGLILSGVTLPLVILMPEKRQLTTATKPDTQGPMIGPKVVHCEAISCRTQQLLLDWTHSIRRYLAIGYSHA
jgi:MFS family permease